MLPTRRRSDSYCKKLTSLAQRNMVEMLTPLRDIGRRIEAGEGAEVMDEMCLVEIPTGQSDVNPVDPLPPTDTAHYLLEALDAAKQLGRQSNFFAKNLDEPPLAKADALREVREWVRMRRAQQLLQRKGDGGVVCQGPDCLRQKELFEDVEPGLRCRSFEQLLAQVIGFRSPEGVQ